MFSSYCIHAMFILFTLLTFKMRYASKTKHAVSDRLSATANIANLSIDHQLLDISKRRPEHRLIRIYYQSIGLQILHS
jgi:hypothetical protein